MAVVAGATGGIGRAVVARLARLGYLVWPTGRDGTAVKALSAELPHAVPWPFDLGNGPPVVPPELTEVDVLVHAAGLFESGVVDETPADRWRRVFDVNLFGVVDLTRALLPALRRARGRVIVINSTVVRGSPAGRAAYAASKEALRVFTEALHQEELGTGVRVTALYPGRVATAMQREVRRREGGPYEPERYLAPETVAAAVASVLGTSGEAHLTELVLHPARGPQSS
ncbi:short chain dehydrogenase [Amycolatopsis bartoniae]|uniref:Short chain dehydrogenase n=1 Tax=Amycolatopsis bartoniae TaxID=941986 RepID=A0A8H9INW2_9PSEU|nr:short chain dehydrogenase [Amycolatopsis bartoniae]